MTDTQVLMELWEEIASVTSGGFVSGARRREVRMSPQQVIALASLLGDEEIEALGYFLRDMLVHDDGAGPRYFVEGFSREYLISEGMAPYRARKGLSGLRAKGLLTDEWAPNTREATSRGWKCLNGAWFAKPTRAGTPRQFGPMPTSPEALTLPTTAAPDGEQEPATTDAGRNASGRIPTEPLPPVDNSFGRISTERNPTPARPVDKAPSAQVKTYGRFSTARDSTATSTSVISEFRTSTGPKMSPGSAAVAAFTRDPEILPRLTARSEHIAAALIRGTRSPQAEVHAVALIDFFALAAPGDHVSEAIHLALYFLTLPAQDSAEVVAEIRAHMRQRKVNVQPMDEGAFLTATGLAILSAIDMDRPIQSMPGWFGHALKPTMQWRTSPTVAALFTHMDAVASAPPDQHPAYSVADLSDPTYVAYLREATDFVVERGILPQFDGPFEDLVMPKDPRVHARIIRTYEQARARSHAG